MSKTHRKQERMPSPSSKPPGWRDRMRQALEQQSQQRQPVEFPSPDPAPLKPLG